MAQLYDRHLLRDTRSLSGSWDFALDPDGVGGADHWERQFPVDHGRMHVPGCWDTQPDTYHYMGTGWYRRRVFLTKAGMYRLVFEGVSGGATVYLDGRKLGDHSGTYTPFTLLTGPLEPGEHQLVVAVDNDHRLAKHFPEYPCDWLQYGGIVRDVRMERVPDIFVEKLRIDYEIRDTQVEATAVVMLHNTSGEELAESVVVQIDRQAIAQAEATVPAHSQTQFTIPLGELAVSLWSTQDPVLHEVRAVCGDDDSLLRVGFRTISAEEGQVRVNGEPIKLLGVNRHDEYGDQGFSMSPDLVQRDFELIASLGANAVRCHYPPSELALDLCDAMGLLWWEEIPFYGRWPFVMGNPDYLQAGTAMLEEMIARDRHHPCVFVWSVMNECSTQEDVGVDIARSLVERVRELDSTRPVSYASNKLLADKGYHLLDLIGINSYPGWYDNKEFEAWPVLLDKLIAKLEEEGLSERPLLITETGAGGIYGDRGFERRKWSEGTQADIVADGLGCLLADERVAGVFIWQFADIRTADSYWRDRPGTFNNKGLVDRFRRPKDVWWRVRDLYHAVVGEVAP